VDVLDWYQSLGEMMGSIASYFAFGSLYHVTVRCGSLRWNMEAVVIPGGGVTENGIPRAWVKSRLDRALDIGKTRNIHWYIVLSRGTPHNPPPPDPLRSISSDSESYFPVDESIASARYLVQNGVPEQQILADSWSLDTIGNAYFCKAMITYPLGIDSLLIVTNEFHMPRTKRIFEWVYSIPLVRDSELHHVNLEFESVPNDGLKGDDLRLRQEKERSSLVSLNNTIQRIDGSPSRFAKFIFAEHGAYNVKGLSEKRVEAAHKSY